MLTAALALGVIGLLAAVGLGVAAKVFYVEVDPLVAAIEEALPGANCGGCGFAGCSAAAEATAAGKMPPNGCVAGGAETHAEIATLVGLEIKETEPRIAQVGCRYPVARADLKFDYQGVDDCRAAVVLNGGPKECPIGCMGLGSCVKACPFDALSMGPDGLPVVDEMRCTGCGTCVRVCPVMIMKLTSVTDRILGEFETIDCTAPCQRTCPAGINIPAYIGLAAKGDYAGSLKVIKERNPLPLVCGRICPHPCELECRRNLADEPVAINPIKRFVSEYERTSGKYLELFRAPASGKQVAVVGGGALGLTAAAFLARLGHEPALFEAGPRLGGLLRTVIPEERLPREVLDFEIEGILKLGVKAECGQVLGRDFSLSSLFKAGFKAVLIAAGGWDSSLLSDGRVDQSQAVPGLHLLLPLMLSWKQGEKAGLGRRVVVVGGGRTALAAAGKAREEGAQEVTVLFTRGQAEAGLSEADLEAAKGAKIIYGAQTQRLLGRGDRLTGLVYRTVADPREVLVETDDLIASSGRLPELIVVPDMEPASTDEIPAEAEPAWQAFRPYGGRGQGQMSLFDPDRTVSDQKAVVEAVGAGRRAAASIHKVIAGEPVDGPERMLTPAFKVLNVSRVADLAECDPRSLVRKPSSQGEPETAPEAELTYTEEEVRKEAQRCLNCGLICYERTRYH